VSATPWLTDLGKVALFASIAGALGVLIPFWNLLRTMGAVGAARPLEFGVLAVSLLATGTMPVFFFALHRNPANLNFPKHLRLLALVAAFVLTLLATWGLPQWVRSLVAYSSALKTLDWKTGGVAVGAVARDPRTIFHLSTLLSQISNLALILLLISFFRHENDPVETDVAISNSLRTVAKTTVIVWGLWLGFNLIRGILTPYLYVQIRNYYAQVHRTPPPAIDLVTEMLSAILSAACWFSAPYIVYKSLAPSPIEDHAVLPDREGSPEPH
jgi:hypothetical protein